MECLRACEDGGAKESRPGMAPSGKHAATELLDLADKTLSTQRELKVRQNASGLANLLDPDTFKTKVWLRGLRFLCHLHIRLLPCMCALQFLDFPCKAITPSQNGKRLPWPWHPYLHSPDDSWLAFYWQAGLEPLCKILASRQTIQSLSNSFDHLSLI